ncbi:MAG: pyridoxamine 5'-phosphate oxidase [Gaiellaceae bacterium]
MPIRPLLERELDPDPRRQFAAWLREAEAAAIPMPEAMALATAAADGSPSVRMVLLKGHDERGYVFYTGYGSRKGRDLATNPRAALLFHWAPLGRQVRIEGGVARLDPVESDDYFRTRPRGSQIAAWASSQTDPIAGRDELDVAAARVASRFEGLDVPLPPSWGGFRLTAERYEFWQHREDRLHDRLAYEPGPGGRWALRRLAP